MATTQQTSDPSQAQGAQIPLQNFHIPTFPPEAGALQALTLTSDISLTSYQDLLAQPYSIPRLPPAIQSLTLELFSLGYPAGFLEELAAKLPNVRSLIVYSQLLGGLSDTSAADAVALFERLRSLRGLHLLDVFARKGFFEQVAPYVTYNGSEKESEARRGLMFLEVNYTTQNGDEEFLSKVPATELPLLIGPGLVTLALNVSEPDVTNDPEDPNNASRVQEISDDQDDAKDEVGKDGIMTFNRTLSPALVKALTEEESRPRNLRVLNTTLYTVTLHSLEKILEKQSALMVLMITLEVEDGPACKKHLIQLLEKYGEKLEQVEVVVSPGLQFFMAVSLLSHSLSDQRQTLTLSRS